MPQTLSTMMRRPLPLIGIKDEKVLTPDRKEKVARELNIAH